MPDTDFAPFMEKAIILAERGRWDTAPNPVVGALLLNGNRIVAEGWHRRFGGPHAEINCLDDALAKGIRPRDCTLVVTLEPCTHIGKTGPCTQAILDAGIRHVIIGMPDPNPSACGGAKLLAEHGVTVAMGVCMDDCAAQNEDFLIWQREKRPYVIVKLAMTLDGHIADRTGASRWISNPASRGKVHRLRADIGRANGIVIVGSNTLFMDNPSLSPREVPCGRQPLAGSFVSKLPSDGRIRLLSERPENTILFTTPSLAASPRAATLREKGVRLFGLDDWHTGSDAALHQAMRILFETLHCPYVLCEGGGILAHSLLQAGLVDELQLYLAPKILDDVMGRQAFGGTAPVSIEHATPLRLHSSEQLGDDMLLTYRRTPHVHGID